MTNLALFCILLANIWSIAGYFSDDISPTISIVWAVLGLGILITDMHWSHKMHKELKRIYEKEFLNRE